MTLLLQRLLLLIPTLVGVSLLTFFLMRMAPGDPVRLMLGSEATPEVLEAKRKELGLDRPLYVQYLMYMGLYPQPPRRNAQGEIEEPGYSGVLQGDLGRSIVNQDRTVAQEIFTRLPATIELAVVAMFFATVVGVTVGTVSAVNPRSYIEGTSRLVVFVCLAMPSFWLGLELIIIASRHLQWFPPSDRGHPWLPTFGGWQPFYGNLSHLFLPSLTLGLGTGALLCRILRSSMLQVLSMDYIRTARAKGLDSNRVILKHAMKNAMIPFVTVAGLSLGVMLGGSVIVETVFNWPGVGRLFVDSILQRNFPVTMGCVLVLATIFVLVNLAVDLLYMAIDPRIRVEG